MLLRYVSVNNLRLILIVMRNTVFIKFFLYPPFSLVALQMWIKLVSIFSYAIVKRS